MHWAVADPTDAFGRPAQSDPSPAPNDGDPADSAVWPDPCRQAYHGVVNAASMQSFSSALKVLHEPPTIGGAASACTEVASGPLSTV